MILSEDLVNAYAGPYKVGELTPVNVSLEQAAIAEVYGHLSQLRPLGGWTDESNTPMLVKKLVAMYYVGRSFQEAYAQDVGTSDYGTQLIKDMYALLKKILSGDVILIEEPDDNRIFATPSFEFPGNPIFSMEDKF